jgi:pimeloyl-ACP methyl ester carboxylesterase
MTARIITLFAFVLIAAPASPQQTGPASFDSNGVKIQYVDRGQGVPVVLLHGFTGSYARHWEGPGVMDALQTAGYRVIAMDCRGHGQSGKPHDASQYGVEMVHDVVRLLDHLHIDRAHIVGYSMGGAIANQLLARYPVRVRTATLLGAGWEGEDLTAITSFMNALADGFAKRDASPLISRVNSSSPNAPTPTAAEIAAMSEALFARNDAEALAAVARAMPALFAVPVDRLRAITVPVLAIVGENDTPNVPAVKRMASVVRGLEVVELPGADHATSVRPSAKPLIAFLNKQPRN